jgi:hypothetical protein
MIDVQKGLGIAMTIDTSKISKTTISGFLSAAIAVAVAISVLPPHLATVVYVLAALKALNGFLQKDAQ